MKIFRRLRALLPMRIGAVVAVLLLVSAAGLKSGDKKSNTPAPAPARQQAPVQRQQAPPPAPARQAPAIHSAPVRQPPAATNPGRNNRLDQGVPRNQPPAQRPVQQGQPQQQPGQQSGRPPGREQPGQQFGRPPGPQQQPGRAPGQPAFAPRPGAQVERGPGNRQVVQAPNGSQVHVVNGRVAEVHTADGAVIHHAPDGRSRVEVMRPGGRTVVVNGRGSGYVQRSVMVGNRSVVHRTYVVHGMVATRFYRPYTYHSGLVLNVYTPVRYYRPGLYMYAYNPWARPVIYSGWGFGVSPWYGFYGGYFAPAPYYPGPAYWLTDYMMAATLEQAYQDRMAANPSVSAGFVAQGEPAITDNVRQQIADEISRQLRQEQAEAQSAGSATNVNPFSGDTPHVFVADTSVDAVAGDQTCALTEGDVVGLRGAPPLDASTANVEVLASKGGCPKGAMVTVALQDLAEMQNHMRELVDRGLGDMQQKQGQGGLPAMTGEAAAPAVQVSWASQIQPDQGVEGQLNLVSDEATRAEQEAVNGALNPPAPAAPHTGAPPTVEIGSSIEDVVAVFGQPQKTANLGAKVIYVYKDVKVTFQSGKVIDVQ